MNEENGKHEFNIFLDKELQEKLLELHEELLEKEFSSSLLSNTMVSSSKNNNNIVGSAQHVKLPKYPDCVHVCGWCPDTTVVYRRSECDIPPRSRGNVTAARDSLYSRDLRSRPQVSSTFVFRHYTDPRKYIEQYRKENTCYDSTNSFSAKNEFLDSRRFYAYNQSSPLAVGSHCGTHSNNSYAPQPQLDSQVQSNESAYKINQQTPAFQYTNRRDLKNNTLSGHLNTKPHQQYKLSKPPNKPENEDCDYTEEYVEALEVNGKQKHSASGRERTALQQNVKKSARINVPCVNYGTKSLRTSSLGVNPESMSTNHFSNQKVGQITLDALACVAGNGLDRQMTTTPTTSTTLSSTPSSLSPCLRLEPFLTVTGWRCHNQMWFDASGRAYVSLATRYGAASTQK